jgi:hypothetical protein
MRVSRTYATICGLIWAALVGIACQPAPPRPPTPTPDYPALETRVAAQLGATMTAKAPIPTETPTRRPTTPNVWGTPTLVPTASPTPEFVGPMVAFARLGQNQAVNIIVRDAGGDLEEVLTHFTEPLGVSDISWSKDGEWIAFVSSHGYMQSRNNERNVFAMRYDGTELHMVTGDHVDAEGAPGPYIVLSGRIVDGQGTCVVSAQGVVNPVEADGTGAFELVGVPISSQWARAVCQEGTTTLQGDIGLQAVGDGFPSITIPVQARGQGWRRVSVSKAGAAIGGIFYRWELDEEQKPVYTFQGLLADLEAGTQYALEIPANVTFLGLDWSPLGGIIAGALTSEKETGLWLFAPDGAMLRPIVKIANPEQEILTAANPVWSPDGSRIAFELRHWYWWGENRYRTEIMVVSPEGENLKAVVETDWGVDATSPSWMPDGEAIYYQLSTGEPGDDFQSKTNGNIYVKAIEADEPIAWTEDGSSYYPAVRPVR